MAQHETLSNLPSFYRCRTEQEVGGIVNGQTLLRATKIESGMAWHIKELFLVHGIKVI